MAFRTFLNKVGRVFDALKVREVFAEDLNEIQARIVALEGLPAPVTFTLKSFNDSFLQNITASTQTVTVPHGLGKIPKGIDVQACVTYDLRNMTFVSPGHSDGVNHSCVAVVYDPVNAPYYTPLLGAVFKFDDGGTQISCLVTFDATNIYFQFVRAGAAFPRVVILAYQVFA